MTTDLSPSPTAKVLIEVLDERRRQDEKWGEQNHPDGTGPFVRWLGPGGAVNEDDDVFTTALELAEHFRAKCQANGPEQDNYVDILMEEVAEAFAEQDPAKLRAELIQVAAVCVQWVEAIDRRGA